MKIFDVVETRSGRSTLKVSCDDASVKTLHSLYDPEAEVKSMVDAFTFNGKGILVVLGLGLGYHVYELYRCYPESKIIVIEYSSEIYKLAREHGPALDDKIIFITGLSPDESLREIARYQMDNGVASVSVFPLFSAVSAYPLYYNPILASLRNTESVKLWDRLRYKKFQTENLTVLMIDSGYFLLTETEKALTSFGHKVVRVQVNKQDTGDQIISGMMKAIIDVKPDFLMTVNHIGLDEEGKISDFLQSIEMPVASWYVDSPNLILKAFNKNVSPNVALFMWDRSYIHDMKLMGFELVEYLPLATDEKVFRPLKSKKHKKKLSPYLCDVSFIGNSMVEPVEEWMGKVNENIRPVVDRVSSEFIRTGNIMQILRDDEKMAINGLNARENMDFEAAVIWNATLHYRLGCLNELSNQGLKIYGDEKWRGLVNSTVEIFKPLNYYKELPFLYNACKINFNATSLQMREAVNQRVFDVPACGSFLITDEQKSLNELFERGKEVITYKNKDELLELVKFILIISRPEIG